MTRPTLSRRMHNRIWQDRDQSICSRAWDNRHDPRWMAFVIVMNLLALLFWEWRWNHCRNSWEAYHGGK